MRTQQQGVEQKKRVNRGVAYSKVENMKRQEQPFAAVKHQTSYLE